MQIQTPFGPQQIDPSSVITFPKGLPGFENCTRFKLFYQADADAPVVHWLQSLDEPELMFSVADPAIMNVDYHFELNDEEMAMLHADQPAELMILLLLYKGGAGSPDAPKLGANKNVNAALRAPLIINMKSQVGMQKSLHDASISVLVKGKPGL